MNPQDQDLIAQASAQQLGVSPPAAMAPQAPPASIAPQEMQPTPQEMAAKGVSPSTEGDLQSADAAQIMRVKFGDDDMRELSEAQVKGTFDRYSALNFKHQNMKPVMDLAEKMLAAAQQKNPNASAKDLAKFMTAAAKSQTHNPQMGKGTQDPAVARAQQSQSAGDVDAMMKQWEDDNAVSLPPRFRETMDGMEDMRSQNSELRGLLEKVIQGQQGVTDSTQKQLDSTDMREGNVIQQRIGNNLAKAQSALNLPDESEQEFMQFAYSRGYTVEDFIDPELTMTVAQDFKANQDAPELERLRGITQKRQAFTGNASGTPAVSNQPMASSPDKTFIDAAVNKAMTSRGQMG
jgi:hypothetical protein